MKKILFTIAILCLVSSAGYCEEKPQPLVLTLSLVQRVYFSGEHISFSLKVKNTGSEEIPILEFAEGNKLISLIFDGKVYKNTAWDQDLDPSVVPPKGEVDMYIELDCYGINDNTVVLGEHSAAVKIYEIISNIATIQVVEKGAQVYSVDLQEGFSGDKVIVKVDNKILYEGNPVTRAELSLAQGIDFSVNSNAIILNIQVPSREINLTKAIDLSKGRAIGVSIKDAKVHVNQQDAFHYE